MSVDPAREFEDPSKSAMRDRCRIAVEASAYELIEELKTFPAPKKSGLFGGIRGDLQSRTQDHKRVYAYYIRPGRLKAAPKWLANIGEMSRHMTSVAVFLVVEESNQVLLESCRACGIGMLRLTNLDGFELLVEPLERKAAEASTKFQELLDSTRRALELKLDRQLNILTAQFGDLPELTRGMTEGQQNRYAQDLEREERLWREWSDQISAMLDEAVVTRKTADLEAIADLIDEGPTKPEL
jgi:hypothetical protein